MYFAGIDVGSNTTKAVIIKDSIVVGKSITKTGGIAMKSATEVYQRALTLAQINQEKITASVATGYGRNLVKEMGNYQITEITCFARGAFETNPQTRTIIDIGGQDSKVIRIDEKGRVTAFEMNDKCSAGTGKFLEVMANTLKLELEEIGKIVLNSDGIVSISSTCTVFAESEVISRIAGGTPQAHILSGLHKSMAVKVAELAKRVSIQPDVLIAGGVAYNEGIVYYLSEQLKTKIKIAKDPQLVGAFGAALLASEKYANNS
ncbi:MAG: acyl-CoA dehydratase activase [Promethearchaeota archaeon]